MVLVRKLLVKKERVLAVNVPETKNVKKARNAKMEKSVKKEKKDVLADVKNQQLVRENAKARKTLPVGAVVRVFAGKVRGCGLPGG